MFSEKEETGIFFTLQKSFLQFALTLKTVSKKLMLWEPLLLNAAARIMLAD